MELKLAENIRRFRKEKKLTQEKLADALGVTVGAVHKWEAGLSVPELNLIIGMADFFDTSVDVLLGYSIKDNRIDSILERLTMLCRTLDPAALTEAEKALAKYPHSFPIVNGCGGVYLVFGTADRDPSRLRRSLELFDRATVLLPQNDDPRVNEATISSSVAIARFLLGEREKCLEILKQNNAGEMFSSEIGMLLSVWLDRPDEASKYLSDALIIGISTLLNVAISYVFLYRSRGDWDSALEIIQWAIGILRGIKTKDMPDMLEKTHAELLALLACIQKKAGMREVSRDSLVKAAALARHFDAAPDYSLKTMRFGEAIEQSAVFDIFGATAAGGVSSLLGLFKDPKLCTQWKEIISHE